MKKIIILFEILFVLSVAGILAGTFGVETLEKQKLIFYIIGIPSFILSLMLRKKIDNQSTQN